MTEKNKGGFRMLLIGQMVVPDGSVFVYGRADKTFLLYPVELVITRIAIGSKQLIKFLADIRVFRCNLWVLSKKAGIYPVFNGKHLWFFRPGSGCKIPWHTVTTGSRVINRIGKLTKPFQGNGFPVHGL